LLIELAGKKELDNYSQFLEEYSTQLRCIENVLDEYFEDAWDFNLDPVSLQVHEYFMTLLLNYCV